jgi:hypothetical protein
MYAATGDHKYIDYLDKQWQQTSDLLYDKDEHRRCCTDRVKIRYSGTDS